MSQASDTVTSPNTVKGCDEGKEGSSTEHSSDLSSDGAIPNKGQKRGDTRKPGEGEGQVGENADFVDKKTPKRSNFVFGSAAKAQMTFMELAAASKQTDFGELGSLEENISDQPPSKKLQTKTIQTGEEDEELVFSAKARIFEFDNKESDWKERGCGILKVNLHPSGEYRVIARSDGTMKVLINHWISEGFNYSRIQKRSLRMALPGDQKLICLLLRLNSEVEAIDLYKALDEISSKKKLTKKD